MTSPPITGQVDGGGRAHSVVGDHEGLADYADVDELDVDIRLVR